MYLSKIASNGTTIEFINSFLGEILPTGDVDGLEPAFFTPAPCGALSHTNLFQPFGETDNRSTNGY